MENININFSQINLKFSWVRVVTLFLQIMKKIGANLFLIVYLFFTTEAYQLLKAPMILQHFHEHQKKNFGITFLEFLDIHYLNGSPVDDDYDRDMHLPFKKVTHQVNPSLAYVKDLTTTQLIIPFSSKEAEFFIFSNQNIESRNPSSIFHPPKV